MRAIPFLAHCIASTALAQPVLQYANLGIMNTTYDLYAVIEPGDSDPAEDGADITWDFTSATVDLVGAALFTAPAGTPYAASYPTANLALTVITATDTAYTYYLVDATGIQTLASDLGSANEEVYTDPKKIITFPFTYGDSYVDDFAYGGNNYSVTRTCTGYGAVQSLLGTTTDVLKQTSSNGELAFFNSDPVRPVLSVNEDGFTILWELVPIGLREGTATTPLRAWPNPTRCTLHIGELGGPSTYTVVDLQGRVRLTGNTGSLPATIDLSSLSAGSYLLHLMDGDIRHALRVTKE